MDKKDYFRKVDTLVNAKHTYEPLKSDLTPALQRKINSKLLDTSKRLTPSTYNFITDSGKAYYNHPNHTDYLTYTKLMH